MNYTTEYTIADRLELRTHMTNQQPMYDKDGLPITQPTSQFQGFGQYGQTGQFGQFGQGSPYGQPQMQQFAPAQMQSCLLYTSPSPRDS